MVNFFEALTSSPIQLPDVCYGALGRPRSRLIYIRIVVTYEVYVMFKNKYENLKFRWRIFYHRRKDQIYYSR
jgi:hypothetical protein